MSTIEQTINDGTCLPQSWLLLRQQVLHLAQFGGSVQVIIGENGAGKTTFLTSLCEVATSLEFICLSADSSGSVQELFNQLADALGLLLPTRSSVGQQIAAMRSFAQALEKDQERAVIAIDNAERLDESALAALVSVLQGHSDSGFGLHFIFLSQPGLPERIDQLHLLDVTVHDAILPGFSHQEIARLLEIRSGHASLDALQIKNIWRESGGLPGEALKLAPKALDSDSKDAGASIFNSKIAAMPVTHIFAVTVLAVVLVWALVVREDDPEDFVGAVDESAENVSSSISDFSTKPERLHENGAGTAPAVEVRLDAHPIKSGQSTELAVSGSDAEKIPSDSVVGSKVDSKQVISTGNKLSGSPASSAPPIDGIVSASSSSVAGLKIDRAGLPAPKSQVKKKEAVKTSGQNDAQRNAEPSSNISNSQAVDGGGTWFEKSQRHLTSLPETGYVLQLMALSDLKALESFATRQANFGHLFAYKTRRNNRDLYVLVEGFYADKNSAIAAIKNLPASQQRGGPWAKALKTIREERDSL